MTTDSDQRLLEAVKELARDHELRAVDLSQKPVYKYLRGLKRPHLLKVATCLAEALLVVGDARHNE